MCVQRPHAVQPPCNLIDIDTDLLQFGGLRPDVGGVDVDNITIYQHLPGVGRKIPCVQQSHLLPDKFLFLRRHGNTQNNFSGSVRHSFTSFLGGLGYSPASISAGSGYTPYEYYICTVKLKNKDLSHLPVEVLTEEQLSAYSLYMRTLGNRPDLFGKAQYPNASTIKQPTYYDIPPEALKDDRFAAMMEEATKYIGYPYVWGGSSPSTSFDCSGYISWVLNHSGWNVGRQNAQGLYNLCTPVSAAQVKPGDLVFFKGTYDTPGVSHCGIYVNNSIMLHCGDPISYTNLNSKYWQEHFYSYGRLP